MDSNKDISLGEWFNYIAFSPINDDKSFYHYTSPEGLLGILQPDKTLLWFSQYNNLNDSSEGTHIVDIYKDTLEDLLNEKEIDKSFYDIISDCEPLTIKSFCNPSRNGLDPEGCSLTTFNTYICCFSKKPDSIDMWRHYIKNNTCNGFCIELHRNYSMTQELFKFRTMSKSFD